MNARTGLITLMLGVALCGCGSTPAPGTARASGNTPTEPADLHERSLHRRAVEAALWGMPAVNFERMLQAAQAQGAKVNQVVYWSQPVNAQNQTLTPNPDTIYFNPFYDTSAGPLVLEIPPVGPKKVIVGSADDAWQNALADFGPAGLDQGQGGKFLITPPGYAEKAPAGYTVLPSPTFRGFVILRSNFETRSAADIAAAVEHGKHLKLYPLGGDAGSTVFVDVYDKPFDATIPYDASFFETLDRFVQAEPWLPRDKVMIEYLRTLGIEKGKPFQPDAKTKAILADAAREAHEQVAWMYESAFTEPFFAGTHWALPVAKETVEGMGSGFADPDSYPIDGRAVMYSIAYFSPKQFAAGQFYLLTIDDSAGRPFDGQHSYTLTVPPNAPLEQYWSATAYDRQTHALIRGVSRASLASNTDGVRKNPDGSVTIVFGPQAPAGGEANWVPTKGRDFEVLFRVYGPKPAFFQKQWALPDLVRVD